MLVNNYQHYRTRKVFRGIWLKKFGTLLSLINDDPLTPSLKH